MFGNVSCTNVRLYYYLILLISWGNKAAIICLHLTLSLATVPEPRRETCLPAVMSPQSFSKRFLAFRWDIRCASNDEDLRKCCKRWKHLPFHTYPRMIFWRHISFQVQIRKKILGLVSPNSLNKPSYGPKGAGFPRTLQASSRSYKVKMLKYW